MYFGYDQEKPLHQQWVCPAPTELGTATQLMHLLLLKATAECLNAFLGAQGLVHRHPDPSHHVSPKCHTQWDRRSPEQLSPPGAQLSPQPLSGVP